MRITKRFVWLLAGAALAPAISYGVLDRFGLVGTEGIADGSITYPKIQDVSEGKILGRGTGSGDGDVQELTPGAGLALVGTTLTAVDSDTETTGGNYILSGCGVAWNGSLSYTVSACTYVIQGTQYTSAQTNITLAASDPTLDRFDAFVVNTSSVADDVTGTPAATPEVPDIDAQTQLQISLVYVAAGATAGSGAIVDIYRENAGGEWTYSDNTANLNPDSTTNPRTGSKAIRGTSVTTSNLFTLNKGSTIDPSAYNAVVLWIAPTAAWPSTRQLRAYFMNGTSLQVGSQVTINEGAFGLNTSSTSYQAIVIPTNLFNTGGALVDRLRINTFGSGATIAFDIDDVYLQAGIIPPAQAAPRMNYRGDYSATAAYTPQDVVRLNARLYVAVNPNVGSTPSATDANANWKILAVRTVETADIADSNVTVAKIQGIGTDKLLGRDTAGTGTIEQLDATGGLEFTGSGGVQRSALTGDVTASAGSGATTIANDAVTYAKMQNVAAASRLLCRGSAGGAGDVEECTVGSGLTLTGTVLAGSVATESIIVAASDETTAITTGTSKLTFRMPYAFTVTGVRASVGTAPTGSTIIVDINDSGTTILSTKLSIDASEKTSTTAASAAVISDSALADDAEVTIDFDQVGSTIAGAGVKVTLIGVKP